MVADLPGDLAAERLCVGTAGLSGGLAQRCDPEHLRCPVLHGQEIIVQRLPGGSDIAFGQLTAECAQLSGRQPVGADADQQHRRDADAAQAQRQPSLEGMPVKAAKEINHKKPPGAQS